MYKYALLFAFLLTISLHVSKTDNLKKTNMRQNELLECQTCKAFTESFKGGIERTSKSKFEGGDTAWEEEKLGSYATSELRLVEIQEQVCSDIKEHKDLCYSFHEEYDQEIEKWWFYLQKEYPDLYNYLCIEKLKLCCPDFHYGTNCLPCPGYPQNICSNNGICKGNGTRKGSGKCACQEGYIGKNCDTCSKDYFESYRDDIKIICLPCSSSCKGTCTGCEKCDSGWIKSEGDTCLDIDECLTLKTACPPSQFCLNTQGSYVCLPCDISCESCFGTGPQMCIKCAKGYKFVKNTCIENMTYETYNIFKILMYLGLYIATCVVYKANGVIAAIAALSLAIYIVLVEYVINILKK